MAVATVDQQIQEFFDAYAGRFNKALGDNFQDDIEGTTSAFADCFIEASPVGISCGKNDENFRAQIPKGNAYYRSIGTQSMNVKSIDVTPLDDYHAQAKVYWQSRYQKKDGSNVTIDFEVIYMLQILNGPPKIFAYITGDEQKVLQEHGLISG
jgi:hypothetical protein